METNIVFINFFFLFLFPPKIVPLRDNVEKFCRAEQTTDDNMAHAHCMPHT
jgi:hypothetical protein